MLKTRAGLIYIVKNKEINKEYYKVGYTTKDVGTRINSAKNTFSPTKKLEVVGIYACLNPQKMEREIHAKIENKRDKETKEWFRINLKDLKEIIIETLYENNNNAYIEKNIEIIESASDSSNVSGSEEDKEKTAYNNKIIGNKKFGFGKILLSLLKYILYFFIIIFILILIISIFNSG